MKRIIIIIITFAAFFIIASQLKAQVSTKPFYFPHKTGDMWEYFYDDYSPMYVDTLQNFTIFDSTDSRGIIYIKQHSQFINPIKPGWPDTNRYWIDTVNNYVWGKTIGRDSALIYKLNAQKGEQWVVWNYTQQDGRGYEIARIKDKWEGSIFGKTTTFLGITYYYTQDSTDTTGYSAVGGDLIADGFGLISRGGGDLSGRIHLIGAVINGIIYGDTTLVSVKDEQNFLPIAIKLYQNYPNPFNPSTTISFELSSSSNISLIIYDILGKEIKRLIDSEERTTGLYKTIWNGIENNGKKAASGIYFYRLITNKQVLTKSMIILK